MSQLFSPVGPLDHTEGAPDAPVTLVEYGDFQCPYCGELYDVIKDVQRAMDVRLRFVFRHFPLTNLHQHALHAAEFSQAASSIGNFWSAHDVLFQNQPRLTDDDLISYAWLLNVQPKDLIVAFNGAYDKVIQSDLDGGLQSGVSGTPTLFINDRRYQGVHDVDAIACALRAALPAA